MARWATLVRRLGVLARRSRVERELDEEMRLHLELREERLRAEGFPASEACHEARRRFGNRLRWREEGIDAWGWRWLEQLGQDARFGARTLSRNPGFAATAILTLAFATGATTAIFSVVNGVLLRPLPFENPHQLVDVSGRNWSEDRGGVPDPVTAPLGSLELEAYIRESTSIAGFVAYDGGTRHLDGRDGVDRVTVVEADRNVFSILGAAPRAGRTFNMRDPDDVAVISAGFWRQRFGRAPSVPGSTIALDGRLFTVIGVMPETFEFPYRGASLAGSARASRTDIWVPLAPLRAAASAPLRRGRISAIARLKPDVTLDVAQAELAGIAARVEAQVRGSEARQVGVRVRPLGDVVVAPVRTSLWILFAAVGLVLVAACANIANLLLARMTVRSREVVTRAALGAGRLRLVRQFLAESLLLSVAGALLGMFVAHWGTTTLVTVMAGRIPRIHDVTLDWRAFAFLLVVCLATAIFFGLAPALAAARVDVNAIARASAGHATGGPRFGQVRDGLVVLEVALAFVLGIGAAIIVREIVRLGSVDTGMVTENVVALHVTPRTATPDYYTIEERVSALPGVRGAGFIQFVPLQNCCWDAMFEIRGRPPDPRERLTAGLRYVTPGYFGALGIPVLRGRPLTTGDAAGARPVILVNEAFARRYFAGEDPVGRELNRGTIAGVVGDVRSAHLDRPTEPEIYYSAAQNVTMTSNLGMSLLVRTAGPPEPLIGSLRAAILGVNPRLAIFDVKTMEQIVTDSVWQLHLYRWLIGLFAALALGLAAMGVFGVIACTTTARTREFAIRLALGSGQRAVARLVLERGLWLTAGGLACGAAGVLALVWLFGDLPGSLRPDVATCAIAAFALGAVTLVACAVPALRAAGVDPVTALRQE